MQATDLPDGDDATPPGKKLYWFELPRSLKRADLDGSNAEAVILFNDDVIVSGIAVDHRRSKLFWATSTAIQRANLDGTSIEDVLSWPFGGINGIALDPTDPIPAVSDVGVIITGVVFAGIGALILRRLAKRFDQAAG